MSKKTIDSKLRIREVAQNLFREKGYSATSMRDLAQAVGVEASTLYSHIKSKEEILQDICFDLAEQTFKAFACATEKETRSDIKLAKAIEAHLSIIANNNDASAVFFYEWRHLSEPYLSDFILMRRSYELKFRQLVIAGIEEGVFKQVDVKFTVLTLFSAMNWTYNIHNKRWNASKVAEQFCELFLTGLIKQN